MVLHLFFLLPVFEKQSNKEIKISFKNNPPTIFVGSGFQDKQSFNNESQRTLSAHAARCPGGRPLAAVGRRGLKNGMRDAHTLDILPKGDGPVKEPSNFERTYTCWDRVSLRSTRGRIRQLRGGGATGRGGCRGNGCAKLPL